MPEGATADPPAARPIEAYRPELRRLAQIWLDRRLAAKVDPSDVVQQALLRSHQAAQQFRGQTDAECRAWLRRILARTMADMLGELRRGKRDIRQEVGLDGLVDASVGDLEDWLADSDQAPDRFALQYERAVKLNEAMETLPDDQREVVAMKHLDGMATQAICDRLGRTPASVASLLRRGLKGLREALGSDFDLP